MASKTTSKKKFKKPTATDIKKLDKAHNKFVSLYIEFKIKYGVSDSYIKGILKKSTKES